MMHKDRRLIPIKLTVLKINGSGEDSVFLGICEASLRIMLRSLAPKAPSSVLP